MGVELILTMIRQISGQFYFWFSVFTVILLIGYLLWIAIRIHKSNVLKYIDSLNSSTNVVGERKKWFESFLQGRSFELSVPFHTLVEKEKKEVAGSDDKAGGPGESRGRLALSRAILPVVENSMLANYQVRTPLILFSVVAKGAPLLGFVGTISGLFDVFFSLGMSDGQASLSTIGIGIAFALGTSLCGLIVALVSIVAYDVTYGMALTVQETIREYTGGEIFWEAFDYAVKDANRGGPMRLDKDGLPPHERELNFVALTDLMTVLLIFIFVSANYKEMKSIPINLPDGRSDIEVIDDTPVITVRKDGNMLYQQTPVRSVGELIDLVEAQRGIDALLLQGDEETPYQYVIAVLDTLRNSGVVRRVDLLIE